MRITRFEKYQEALAYLRESAAAIDQAHALLQEIGLEDQPEIDTGALSHQPYIGIRKLSSYGDAMALSLASAECPACGCAISATCCEWGGAAVVRGRKAA